ncbi:MAG: asparaginase domain-containing protein [Candidatus Aminicenantes bacterium]|nr:asparaginase domain-containing protein [Candidatus Aminicenantes bacterium]
MTKKSEKKPKICLIYTGGTIAMEKRGGRLVPPEDPKKFIKEKVTPGLEEIVDFDFYVVLNKDSTNMNPGDWTKIANTVFEKRKELGFERFVIMHGTDTMHFSSSALAFAFGKKLNFPIVFTGAQTIPMITHGDARINLLRACKVAMTDLAEVVVSFGDYIFRGCRVQKKDERRFDAFESPGYFPIGHISEEIELHPSAKTKKEEEGIDFEEKDFQPNFESGIFVVTLIPGLEPELVLPVINEERCKGVMLQSFGWGNVPNERPYSFDRMIRYMVNKLNKPVIITSQFPAHTTLGSKYDPGLKAIKAGAIPTGNMTSAAAAVKFRWVLAQIKKEIVDKKLSESDKIEEVRKRMQENYVREMD